MKVDPDQLDYPAKDVGDDNSADPWNEIVLFVHDEAKVKPLNLDKRLVRGGGEVKFVMVPARISIDANDIAKALETSQSEITPSEAQNVKDNIMESIHIPSGRGAKDETRLWVALVIGKG